MWCCANVIKPCLTQKTQAHTKNSIVHNVKNTPKGRQFTYWHSKIHTIVLKYTVIYVASTKTLNVFLLSTAIYNQLYHFNFKCQCDLIVAVSAELRGLRFCLRGYTLRQERAFARRGRIHTRTILPRRLVSFLYGRV